MTLNGAETERTFPVVEIFGPTIQGEGPDAGAACYFVRLGGCDYRCSWCDSMHAVEPSSVRAADRMTAGEIVDTLDQLAGDPPLVILSGGNPALHHAGDLIDTLGRSAYNVAIETQGSVWRPWLARLDTIVVSPKPPSSGMASPAHDEQRRRFFLRARKDGAVLRLHLKFPCADDTDYEWAVAQWTDARRAVGPLPLYFSVVTEQADAGETFDDDVVRRQVGDRYAWLAERVAHDPRVSHIARVHPQLHVIAWGAALGR